MLSHGFYLIGRTGAVIGVTGFNEPVDVFPVQIEPPGLIEGTLIPVDSEPVQRVKYNIHSILGGSVGVGVFNAEDKFPLHLSGVKPVEQCRPGASKMQIAGGTRRKSRNDRIHAYHLFIRVEI